MKKFILLTAFLFTTVFVQAAVETGAKAPDFSLPASSGSTISLSDYAGKTVVLEWTNDGCPFVHKHYDEGNMQSLQRKATDSGVVWLSIISSAPGKQGHVTPEQAQQLTEDRDASPTEVLLDETGEVGRLYSAKTTPHMFVIDDQGTLVYQGAIDSISSPDPADIDLATNYVLEALVALEDGEPIKEGTTRPYGCSVKY